jgi:hypothetical protein
LKRWVRRFAYVALACFALLLMFIGFEIATGWRCSLQGQIRPPVPQSAEREFATAGIKDYLRPEDDVFLSYPEWYIVWSYQEKADFQQDHLPSGFPYFGAVRQYWSSYCCTARLIRGKYEFNGGEQLMLVVIGTSFSAEYILRGAYEKTIGRISEWTSHHEATEEDQFAYKVAREYADFVHVRPFYEFRFAPQLGALWSGTYVFGPHILRKWERKLFLTADYTVEAFYCWVIEKLTHLTYGYEPTETYAWIDNVSSPMLGSLQHVKVVKQVGPKAFIVDIPRYQEFTTVASVLTGEDVRFVEIAGNSQIAVSVIAPSSWGNRDEKADQLFSMPILTRPEKVRAVLRCDVDQLSTALRQLRTEGVTIEHIYDY